MIKLYPPKLFYCQNPLFFANKSDVSEIKTLFEKAVAEAVLIDIKPDNETLLQLYSLYKQATKGDINITPPVNAYDYRAKAKYEAWASLKGKSIKDAQSEYIMLVHELKAY